jgi:predicted TIM-barrel enzyme
VLIGSGLTADNIEKYFPVADAFIIGSYFKHGGDWKNEVDADRVIALMNKINNLR